ncbi:MAG: prepilin-type N-terminal cleavage/methylation domain-containing protein [bacterium]
MCRKMRGFTLLELIIVVMIVALLMSLIIPMYSSYQNRLAVQNSAQMIVMDLTQMRQKAISLEALAGIVFNSDLYTYYAFWDHPTSGPDANNFTDVYLRRTTGGVRTYKDVNLQELFQTMVAINVTGNNTIIYFDPTTMTVDASSNWNYSIVTPSLGNIAAHPVWGYGWADEIHWASLVTIQSGNYTSTVWLSREGAPAVATPAP